MGAEGHSADIDSRRKRAMYRASHRGTKEMDWLLGRYAAARIDGMDEASLERFEALLDEPDPLLQQWIMDSRVHPDPRHATLVQDLRIFHELARHP